MDKNKKVSKEDAAKVAEKMYDPSDYDGKDQLSKGLAVTHEQVSDDYVEGTIDGRIDEIGQNDEVITHDGKNLRGNIEDKRQE